MPQAIDLALLREVTAASLSAYDAMKRVRTMADEGARVVAMSEDLLHRAGFLYFLGNDIRRTHLPEDAGQIVEEIVQAYVDIQHAQADLKSALYDLMMHYIETENWGDARVFLAAINSIDKDYRDTKKLSGQIESIAAASIAKQGYAEIEAGRWQQALDIFHDVKASLPRDKEAWRDYLTAYVAKAFAKESDTLAALVALTKLSGAERALNKDDNLKSLIYLLQHDAKNESSANHIHYVLKSQYLQGIVGHIYE